MSIVVKWITNQLIAPFTAVINIIIASTTVAFANNIAVIALIVPIAAIAMSIWFISLALALIDYSTRKDRDLTDVVKSLTFSAIFAMSFSPISFAVFYFGAILTSQMSTFFSKVSDYANTRLFTGDAIYAAITDSITGMGALMLLIAVATALVLSLIIVFQQFRRIGTLIVYQLTGALAIPSMAKGNYESFGVYIKSVIGLSVTQAVQVSFVYAAMISLTSDFSGVPLISSFMGILLFLGFMFTAVKVSQYMKEWAYTSGTTASMGQLAKTSVSTYNTVKMSAVTKAAIK